MASYIKKEEIELAKVSPLEPSVFVNIERSFNGFNTGTQTLSSVTGSGVHDLTYGSLRSFPGGTGKTVIYLAVDTIPENYYYLQADYITGSTSLNSRAGVTSSLPNSLEESNLNLLAIGSARTDTALTFKAETSTSYVVIITENIGSVNTSLSSRWDNIGVTDVTIPKNLEVQSINADVLSTTLASYERRGLEIIKSLDAQYINFTYNTGIGLFGPTPKLSIKGNLK